MNHQHRTALTQSALAAVERGWPVFPVVPGDKTPEIKQWEPRATLDRGLVQRCWAVDGYKIGIATGPAGLVVIDLDVPKPGKPVPARWAEQGAANGMDVFLILCADAGQVPPLDTFTVATHSGGTHLYFTQGETNGLAWGIDTRACGGYVIGPGSIREHGPYEITDHRPPAPLPTWLAERLTPKPLPPQRETPVTPMTGRRSRYLDAAVAAESRTPCPASGTSPSTAPPPPSASSSPGRTHRAGQPHWHLFVAVRRRGRCGVRGHRWHLAGELTPPAEVTRFLREWGLHGITARHHISDLAHTPAERFEPARAHLAHSLAIGAGTAGRGHHIPQLDVTRANSGSARAFADLLQALWTPSKIPAEVCLRVRELMASNLIRQRLAPDFTPDAATWSSKTGTLLNLRHEVGVVEHADGQTFAVAALTESRVAAVHQPEAEVLMARVARLVRDHLRRS